MIREEASSASVRVFGFIIFIIDFCEEELSIALERMEREIWLV